MAKLNKEIEETILSSDEQTIYVFFTDGTEIELDTNKVLKFINDLDLDYQEIELGGYGNPSNWETWCGKVGAIEYLKEEQTGTVKYYLETLEEREGKSCQA